MDDAQDRIVVFKSYDTSVMAGLAKTKLDANGIPCFLSGENINNLYPIQTAVFVGVRLHVFENDLELVKTILAGGDPEIDSLRCPNCYSLNVEEIGVTSTIKKLTTVFKVLVLLSVRLLIFVHFPFMRNYEIRTHRCKDCLKEF